jgi:hypothetical protein
MNIDIIYDRKIVCIRLFVLIIIIINFRVFPADEPWYGDDSCGGHVVEGAEVDEHGGDVSRHFEQGRTLPDHRQPLL